MKKMKWLFILVVMMTAGHQISVKDNTCQIIQENSEQIPVNADTGITEAEFNSILSEFIKVNNPLVKEQGFELVIENKWKDSTVNASTYTKGKKWIINAYGGLARYEGMTADAYTMVLCHELGHHMGGFPKIGTSWASNEGQSDYYATAKCFPRMSYSRKKAFNVPEIVTEGCSLLHKSQKEIQLCEKSSLIGFELASVLDSLSRRANKISRLEGGISFSTPDKTEVEKTYSGHPKAQCRLDTYFAGAMCNMPHTEDFADDNAITGACAEEKGDKIAVRPHCWYKPSLSF